MIICTTVKELIKHLSVQLKINSKLSSKLSTQKHLVFVMNNQKELAMNVVALEAALGYGRHINYYKICQEFEFEII